MRSAEDLVAELNARDESAGADPARGGTRAGRDAARRASPTGGLGGSADGRSAPRRKRGDDVAPPSDDEQEPPGDPEAVARIVCLRMLDRKARSRAELAQALGKRGVPDDVTARVLDRFAEVGLIDDAGLAESVAGAQHRERGLARRAVAAKLRQRGFGDDVVGAAVESISGDDERARAEALVARKLRSMQGLEPQAQTRRLVGLLARKGYPAGLAWDVVKAAVAGPGSGLPDTVDDPL